MIYLIWYLDSATGLSSRNSLQFIPLVICSGVQCIAGQSECHGSADNRAEKETRCTLYWSVVPFWWCAYFCRPRLVPVSWLSELDLVNYVNYRHGWRFSLHQLFSTNSFLLLHAFNTFFIDPFQTLSALIVSYRHQPHSSSLKRPWRMSWHLKLLLAHCE